MTEFEALDLANATLKTLLSNPSFFTPENKVDFFNCGDDGGKDMAKKITSLHKELFDYFKNVETHR
ncbi:hypothetical protein [Chromobacterium haemolyticum]|uniref:Uncharacterized protein n=1 Tax=Chromobacterium haemolyticum TaxID=394935 RepID=A0A1W0CDI2_9NEIS|nr:hypothetical protein [Chromobacterium haemolyticum]OQS32808.1 hypothetical protein B0T45_21130 [Chromobacterium haemolyticum]